MTLSQAIIEYTETFNENFPMFLVQAMPEARVLATIEQCLRTKTPYDPDIKPNVVY